MAELRVVFTGGRDYGRCDKTTPDKLKKKRSREFDYIWNYLDKFRQRNAHYELRFAVGDAPGVDTVVRQWCKENGVRCKRFNANWKKFGNAAGPRRNRRMLDKFKPKLVNAFPGGKGTANTIAEAKRRDILVYQQPGRMPDHAKREAKRAAKAAEKKKSKKGKKNVERSRKSSAKSRHDADRAGSHVPETRKHRKELFGVRNRR